MRSFRMSPYHPQAALLRCKCDADTDVVEEQIRVQLGRLEEQQQLIFWLDQDSLFGIVQSTV